MALMCPIDLDVATLRNEIRVMYGRVAADPDGEFHFHRGPQYAASKLGYDPNQLMQLPSSVTSPSAPTSSAGVTAIRRATTSSVFGPSKKAYVLAQRERSAEPTVDALGSL